METTFPSHLDMDSRLVEMCRVFQSMNRTSYNQLVDHKERREVELALLQRYGIENLLWRRNAIVQAKGTIAGQQELLPLHVVELEWKIQRVKKKLERTASPLKRQGYESRIHSLECKKERIEEQIRNGTVQKAMFGGRKVVGSEEWRLKRRGQFLSVGDGGKKGNLNTRILRDGEAFSLGIRNWPGGDFTVPLHVPERSRMVFEALADGKLKPVVPLKAANGVRPYTVRVVLRKDRCDCYTTIPVPEEPSQIWQGQSVAAVDVNPTHIDATIVNKHGNLIAAKSFNEPALIYARREKRLWLASNLVENVLKWISFFRADAVVIEDLKLRGVEHGRKANRLIANFMHRKLLELISIKALRRELILARIPAAYSSRVAQVKYKTNFPRMSVHQLAAFVLGRRALGLREDLTLDQLKAVAGRVRKRQTWVKAVFLSSHGHPQVLSQKRAHALVSLQRDSLVRY